MIAMAKQQIMGVAEFQKRFNDEKACREHLFHIRWSQGFQCPKRQRSQCVFEFYIHSTFTPTLMVDHLYPSVTNPFSP